MYTARGKAMGIYMSGLSHTKGNYQKELADMYHIYAMDPRYHKKIETDFSDRMKESLDQNGDPFRFQTGSTKISDILDLSAQKGEVLKYIRENRLVKVNKNYIMLNSLISKTREALTQKYMREPTISEISLFLEVPVEVLNDAILANDYVKSLDYTLNDEGKEMDLYDSVGYNEKEFDPMILDLRNEIEKLDPEDRKLINLRYYQDKSQQETSRELGINQVQVSRRETKILVKLNQKLAS